MNKRVVGLTLVLVFLVGVGVAATHTMADDRGRRGHRAMHMHGGKRFGHGMMRILRALDLSDEQKEKVGVALMATRKTSIVARAQLRVARMELYDALSQDAIDEAAVKQLRDQIATLQGELLDARIAVHRSIHGILTPEQRSKARNMFLEHLGDASGGRFHGGGKGHHDGRGHGRFHGGGPSGHGQRQ